MPPSFCTAHCFSVVFVSEWPLKDVIQLLLAISILSARPGVSLWLITTETKQNDEAPNALWWEHYRATMGFERHSGAS